MIRVGTAGWSIPRAVSEAFPSGGTHLVRYSQVLRCAEINSSFWRPHAFAVYKRWAAQTPRGFRFSVKVPQAITHDLQLRRARAPLRDFLVQVRGLGSKLGPILVQLPPSLEFNSRAARTFFGLLRDQYEGLLVCEPRHLTWFRDSADALLKTYRVARVATDPATGPAGHIPGGWTGAAGDDPRGVAYYRLHGSPRMYWSRYPADRLTLWAAEMKALRCDVWCIFDNTATGAAADNALTLNTDVKHRRGKR